MLMRNYLKAIFGIILVGALVLVGYFSFEKLERKKSAKVVGTENVEGGGKVDESVAVTTDKGIGVGVAGNRKSEVANFPGKGSVGEEKRVNTSLRLRLAPNTKLVSSSQVGQKNSSTYPGQVEEFKNQPIVDLLQNYDLSDPATRAAVASEMLWRENARYAKVLARAEELGIPVRIEGPGHKVSRIYDIRGDQPLYRNTLNANASISTGANSLNIAPYGLNGTGMTVGLWDEARARTNHQELAGKVTIMDGTSSNSDHSTHCAGTIAALGVDPKAKGMGTATRINSYDWNSDYAELTAVAAVTASDAAKLSISSHSYGYGATNVDMGRYETEASTTDALVYGTPYHAIFWAAGNEQTDLPSLGGYQSITFNGLAKNIITIAAGDDAVTAGVRNPAVGTLAYFSSMGPCDDGRIKPDVTANGVNLYSCIGTGNTAYDGTYSGTSMATPNASGSTALLVQLYKANFSGQIPSASMLKGLLIHTADDMGRVGPDYQYGWGYLNVKAAADLILAHKASLAAPKMIEGTITTANKIQTHPFVWDGVSPIRATLVWTDPAGTAQTAVHTRTANLVHDLDLKITAPDGTTTYLPYVMPFVGTWTTASMTSLATRGVNHVDNVERVDLDTPTVSGTAYTATISLTGNLKSGVTSQNYSLILTGGANLAANPPPSVTLTAPTDGAVILPNVPITLTATAADQTSSGATGTVTKVEFFDGATKLGEDLSTPYSLPWTPTVSGVHVLTAKATDSENASSSSASVGVTVMIGDGTPVVTSFTPTSGTGGGLVVLTGSNLAGSTSVKFNGLSSSFTVDSATQITATVPSLATTGKISVTNGFGSSESLTNFTIVPILLNENFSAITSGDNTTTSGSSAAWAGDTLFPTVVNTYQAGGAVRLGKTSAAGSITSKTLDLSVNGGVFDVSFDVKGWNSSGNIVVTVSGLTPQTISYTSLLTESFEAKTLHFNGGTANKTITFATDSTTKRAFLDNIIVFYTPAVEVAPVISSPLAQSGTVGSAFNYQITASSSPISYGATGLPGGLGINTSTGAITGTPTVAGTSNVTISATNSAGTGSATLVITVSNPPPPVISSSLTSTGTVGSAFSYSITASGNPTSYGATGLPGGLGINTSTGAITGTPTSAGTSNVTISATNGSGTGSATLVITVNSSASAPVISSSLTATGTVGTAFSYQIAASGSPTLFGATGLPAGLSLNTGTGAISGTPTAAGTSNVLISATNGSGTGTATLVITVSPSGGGTSGLIAGWDFQTTTTGGTIITASPNSPLSYIANFGAGTIYLDGSNGSSSWTSLVTNPEVTSFTGTAVNAGTGFSTTTTSPACLALANSSANGKTVVFRFSMSGRKDLVVSYATQRSGTGFTTHLWETSPDGSNWTAAETKTITATSFAATTLTTITRLDNASTAYLRLTVTGATNATGNNRLDNIQLNATAAATTPTVSVSGTLAAVNTTYGTASSAPTSFTVSGSNLNEGILINPPSGYEISQTEGGVSGYAATQTVGAAGTVATKTIYVRLRATTAVGSYSGNVTCNSAGSAGATVATVASSVGKKQLTISGLVGVDKFYNGTIAAQLLGTPTYVGLVNGDDLSVTGVPNASFSDKNVGVGKTVTILGFTDPNGNYSVTAPTVTATISPKEVAIIGLSGVSRAYNGNQVAQLLGTPSYQGLENGETFAVSGTPIATFADKNVGASKTVAVTGYTAPNENYTLIAPAVMADITRKSVSIAGLSGVNREYDGTDGAMVSGVPALIGIESGDLENVGIGGLRLTSFVSPNAELDVEIVVTGYELTGIASVNYDLMAVSGIAGNIVPRSATITANDQSKVYGTVLGLGAGQSEFTVVGLIGSERVRTVTLTATGGTETHDAVGTYVIRASEPTRLALDSFRPENYVFTFVDGTLTVTDAPTTVTLSEWVTQNGLSGADAAPDADPDHDGVSNLMAYYMALDPKGGQGMVGYGLKPVTDGSLSLTYRRSKGVTGVSATVQASGDLSSSWNTPSVQESVVDKGTYEEVTVTVTTPTGSTKMFMRLKLTQP